MPIDLKKGQKVSLIKSDGAALRNFCVGCNWGAITRKGFFGGKKVENVDLDLSAVMLGDGGVVVDTIYFRHKTSNDGSIRHSGDDLTGDTDGDDGLDNEVITVNLTRVSGQVKQIFFFLNSYSGQNFSEIPYASIRLYEGTPDHVNTVFAQYNIVSESSFAGKVALIMGKLYLHNGEWKFGALGDAYDDKNIDAITRRIVRQYA